jgi:hypothetical protein
LLHCASSCFVIYGLPQHYVKVFPRFSLLKNEVVAMWPSHAGINGIQVGVSPSVYSQKKSKDMHRGLMCVTLVWLTLMTQWIYPGLGV